MNVVSSAIYLPSQAVASRYLDARMNREVGSVERDFKIKTRYYADSTETADIMGFRALESALDKAGLSIEGIDCLIAACGTSAQELPYNAANIYRHFESNRRIHTFDVNMTCLSFVQALELSSLYLAAGKYKRVAIVCSERASVGLDPDSYETSSIFGDGASAFIFGGKPGDGSFEPISFRFETVHEAFDACVIPSGGTSLPPSQIGKSFSLEQHVKQSYFRMDGKKLYRYVFKDLKPYVTRHLGDHGLSMDEIDLVIPHQASAHGLAHVQKVLGIEDDKFFNIFEHFGNQVSVSIPLSLHLALERGLLPKGSKALLLGTSAGMSFGTALLQF